MNRPQWPGGPCRQPARLASLTTLRSLARWVLFSGALAGASGVAAQGSALLLIDPAAQKNSAAPPASAIPRPLPPARHESVAALVARQGRVISQSVIGAGGLTAWTVEKDGRRLVLYTVSQGALTAGALTAPR